ncbi:MAG TPA: YfbK domain-containing protein, partial [Kofleriaceae bacterium]
APLGTVRIRHKQPEANAATESTFPMASGPATSLASASRELRFAFAVAAFADVLRGGAEWSLDDIRAHAAAAAGTDKDRAELLALIDRARALRGNTNQVAKDPSASIAR